MTNPDFARTLSLLRQEKGISQRQAAKALGISQALLSHYENGAREPGLVFVGKACDFYNVSPTICPPPSTSCSGTSTGPAPTGRRTSSPCPTPGLWRGCPDQI